MITDCPEYKILIERQGRAWLNRDWQVAHRMLMDMNDHQRICPKCQAVAAGVGLAGGLFTGAKIGVES